MKRLGFFMAIMVTAMTLGMTSSASAMEGDWGTKAEDWEVNLTGASESWSISDEDITFSETRISGSLGYFFSDSLSVGGTLWNRSYKEDFSGDQYDSSTNYLGLYGAWHFNLGNNMTPFLGAQFGVGGTTSDDGSSETKRSDTFYGLFGGVKWFLSEWAALNAQFNIDMVGIKFDGGNDYDAVRSQFNFGMSVFF